MAQELNLIEKSPSFHNPYVFKEDQKVKISNNNHRKERYFDFSFIEKTIYTR